jgi:UDP-glucose 4-epimerase
MTEPNQSALQPTTPFVTVKDPASVYRDRCVLVTGGAGFIGSHLTRSLLANGAHVRVLDDLSTGKLENLAPSVEFIRGSVADHAAAAEAVRGCSYVYHLAAMVSVPQSVSDPARCFRDNVIGLENMVRVSEAADVLGFVHTSSAAVYGATPSLPSTESDPISCFSPYASSKACGEFLVQAAARAGRLRGASVRLFNVFGPRQDPRSAYAAAISAFVDAANARRPAKIFGTGAQTRDFIPVSEVVAAFLLVGANTELVAGESFNVGLGRATSVIDLVAMIAQASQCLIEPVFYPKRAGDVEHSRASIVKIREQLGFVPTADLYTALAELVRCELPRTV